ncbi:hypothetical protein BDY19DRAFT_566874 [Irpex rosettiformis]|uniref:Uncharacterized protein n=1 Tax=Irpex rosettiformis TaxID=378272 RepID=A0ACB8UCE3_9APHY|nr:hypothetical protein BDY19DRAFT_566874 [Irpex rosettiformis]
MRGNIGGNEATEALTRVIRQRFSIDLENPYKLHVWVFVNRKGLQKAIKHSHIIGPNGSFDLDKFIYGLNQTRHHSAILVYVRAAKEAANQKISAYLEEEVKFLQTSYIIFGDCYHNGYAPVLKDLTAEGYRNKLVLLEGYIEDMPTLFCNQ